MKKISLFFILMLVVAQSKASFEVNFDVPDGGKLEPRFFSTIPWKSSNWHSGIGYSAGTSFEELDRNPNLGDNRMALSSQKQEIRANLITYTINGKNIGFEVGTEFKYTELDNQEFGYLELNNNYQAYSNETEINVSQWALHLGLNYNLDKFKFDFSSQVGLKTDLALKQTTLIKPEINEVAELKSEASQAMPYNIRLDLTYKAFNWLNLIYSYQYEYLPTEYDLKVVDLVGGSYAFVDDRIKAEDTTQYHYVLFQFMSYKVHGLAPYFAVGSKEVSLNMGGTTDTVTDNVLTFGLREVF